jgi:Family of unknown function (DUF5895)
VTHPTKHVNGSEQTNSKQGTDMAKSQVVETTLPVDQFADFDFDQFEGDLIDAGGIPYCQILSPVELDANAKKHLTPEAIKEIESTYGLLLPQEQAEIVNFTPNADWVLGDYEIGEVTVTGYLCRNIRCIVIHRSGMEVQQKIDGQWRFCGMGYENGKATKWIETVEGDRENFRKVSRVLLFFVDAQNNLLHESPLQITTKGGFSGSFGKELTELRRSLDKCFFKAARQSGKNMKGNALGDRAHAFTIMDATIGKFGEDKKKPFACITTRKEPALESIGETKTVNRGDEVKRPVELVNVDWRSLIIPSASEAGKAIAEAFVTYEDFPKPNRGRDDFSGNGGNSQDHTFFGIGRIESEPEIEYSTDGSVIAGFKFVFARGNADATQWCEVGGELAEMISDRWTEPGLKVTGVFSIDGRWNQGKPVVKVEAIEFPQGSNGKDDDLF